MRYELSQSAIAVAVLTALSISASPALAQSCDPSIPNGGNTPSFSDLAGVTVTACAGFYTGNAINSGNAASLGLVNSVLSGWGLGPVTGWIEKYDTNNATIDFSTLLGYDTVVAFHWGNFPDAPDRAGNVSAIYRFDAGAGVDTFRIAAGSQGLSNAAVYVTTPIPEPSTYALMLAGLGLVGFMARRRRSPT